MQLCYSFGLPQSVWLEHLRNRVDFIDILDKYRLILNLAILIVFISNCKQARKLTQSRQGAKLLK
jgi:hypothetical protein